MRTRTKRLILGGSGLAAAAAAALVFAATGSGASTISAAQIQSLVTSNATTLGDSTPTDISYSALTTRNAANVASGGGGQMGGDYGSASGYYLVVAHGNFTATDAIMPPGDNNYPTGTVMTLVVDAATGAVTDWGVQNNTPNLSTLGQVTTIASS